MLAALPGVPKTGEVAAKTSAEDQRPPPASGSAPAGPRARATARRRAPAGRAAGGHAAAAPWIIRLSRSSSTAAGPVSAAIAPSRTTRMRSASASTSGRSRDTTRMALPARGQRVEAAVDLGPGRRHRRRASARSARRRRRPRDASARAAPSAGCRRTRSASAPRARRRRRRIPPRPARPAAAPPRGRRCRAARAAAPSEATAMFSRSGRLGRMPSACAPRSGAQIPAAAASCGPREHQRPPVAADRRRASATRSPPRMPRDLVLPGAEQAGQGQRPRRAGSASDDAAHARAEAQPFGATARRRPASGRSRRSARSARRSSRRSAAPPSSRRAASSPRCGRCAARWPASQSVEHLAEAVRDVEDRHALRLQPARSPRRAAPPRAARAAPSARRGSGPRIRGHRLGDLDHLPLGQRQRGRPGCPARCRGRAARAPRLPRAAMARRSSRPAAPRLAPEREVFAPPSGCGSRLSSW